MRPLDPRFALKAVQDQDQKRAHDVLKLAVDIWTLVASDVVMDKDEGTSLPCVQGIWARTPVSTGEQDLLG